MPAFDSVIDSRKTVIQIPRCHRKHGSAPKTMKGWSIDVCVFEVIENKTPYFIVLNKSYVCKRFDRRDSNTPPGTSNRLTPFIRVDLLLVSGGVVNMRNGARVSNEIKAFQNSDIAE